MALSLTLITNYYIGFMVCIFSCIYFIYRLLSGKIKKRKKELFKKIGIFIISSIIAALIASIILIPIFIGLKNGRAEFNTQNMSFDKNFNIFHLISKIFTNAFEVEEIQNFGMPPLFCGIFINILVCLYFLNKKVRMKEKIFSFIVLALFIVSFYIKGANLLWSMGNKPAWYMFRYAFMFSFIYIILAKRRI